MGAALMSVILTEQVKRQRQYRGGQPSGSIRERCGPNRPVARLLSKLPSQVLAPDFPEHLANDLSRAYAGVFVVAMIVLAATAIPAFFLPKRRARPVWT